MPAMLNVDQILKSERLVRATTGLNCKAFEQLLPSFTLAYEQRQTNPDVIRQRAPGGDEKRLYAESGTNCSTFCSIANAIPPSIC
jgi:hypothetical protein